MFCSKLTTASDNLLLCDLKQVLQFTKRVHTVQNVHPPLVITNLIARTSL